MASFSAELHVNGYVIPLTRCRFDTFQGVGQRGRPNTKAYRGPVELWGVVPAHQFLEAWAASPHQTYAADVLFKDIAHGGATLETLHLPAAYCVHYEELFRAGDVGDGAYTFHARLTDPQGWTLTKGGPANAAAVRPAAGAHGSPLVAAATLVAPAAAEAAKVSFAEHLAEAVVKTLDIGLSRTVLLANFLLMPHPLNATERQFPLPDKDALRLAGLASRHAAGETLTADEETEYIALLAKVKGVRIKSLADLNVAGSYKGEPVGLPGFHYEDVSYTKRDPAAVAALRRKFNPVREAYVKKISSAPATVAALRAAGLSDDALATMQKGEVPKGYQVHHQLPLDDSGDNSFGNLLLIEQTPYHSVITTHQLRVTGKLKSGDSAVVPWPFYRGGVVYPPRKP